MEFNLWGKAGYAYRDNLKKITSCTYHTMTSILDLGTDCKIALREDEKHFSFKELKQALHNIHD